MPVFKIVQVYVKTTTPFIARDIDSQVLKEITVPFCKVHIFDNILALQISAKYGKTQVQILGLPLTIKTNPM